MHIVQGIYARDPAMKAILASRRNQAGVFTVIHDLEWRRMNKGAIGDALAAAMVHSRAPMALSDPDLPDTPMVAINQAFVDPCGYPHEDLIGRNCRFL